MTARAAPCCLSILDITFKPRPTAETRRTFAARRPSIKGKRTIMTTSRTLRLAAASMLALAALAGAAAAKNAHFQSLYTFTGGADGGWPAGNLIADKSGNLYGTTSVGGPNGAGTVFKLAPDGTETVIYHFTGATDGDLPMSSLLMDKQGNFYGVTEIGGANGLGNVFKVTPDGVETTLYSFGASEADGANPICQLIWGPHQTLLGTTVNGGVNHDGTVFQVTLDGKATILHAFTGDDGRFPHGGVVMDKAGNIYGDTFNAGAGSSGTLFKIDAKGKFSVLYTLSNATGYFPYSALKLDTAGNLYGTATAGGSHDYGTVFELTTGGALKVLYSFTNGVDGSVPNASLFFDKQGDLLSTTSAGGTGDNGTVFSLAPSGKLTTLYSFTGATGSHSQAGLIKDKEEGSGWFYGSTYSGGSGNGVIFRVK
jgi:uncharacterized repeat protein (TIGR03803 family)